MQTWPCRLCQAVNAGMSRSVCVSVSVFSRAPIDDFWMIDPMWSPNDRWNGGHVSGWVLQGHNLVSRLVVYPSEEERYRMIIWATRTIVVEFSLCRSLCCSLCHPLFSIDVWVSMSQLLGILLVALERNVVNSNTMKLLRSIRIRTTSFMIVCAVGSIHQQDYDCLDSV